VSPFRGHRPVVVLGFLLLALFVVAVTVRPATTDDGPGGVAALRRLLQARGVDVSSADEPGAGTFFLVHDLRTSEQARPILDWVRSGGRLVVADPASELLAAAGIRRAAQPVAGFVPEQRVETDCVLPAIVGVDRIVAGALDAVYRVPPVGVGCFRRGAGAFLVRRPLGAGEIIALGGSTPLTNESLDEEDDVVLAWNVLGGPGGDVVFGTPLPAGASTPPGLWGLLPDPARAVILQLAVAVLAYAVARGRRLGAPVEEAVPSPIPATELVVSVGDLYRRARASAHAAAILRDRFRARAGRRLGLGARPEEGKLSRAVAEATGVGPDDVARMQVGGHEDERALVAAARQLERLERSMEGGDGWETPARR
jgi:hypothetical protein